VVDTSVLVAGIAGFQPRFARENRSARFLRDWIEERSFVWLVSHDILDEYTDVLRRLGVKPADPFATFLRRRCVSAAMSPKPICAR
jgi:hypothetical protein